MRPLAPALLAVLLLAGPAAAEEPAMIEVTIRDHRFSPSEIHVPAGKPVILSLRNEDLEAEEFDSAALKVEKVIVGGKSAPVRLRPLAPGRYPFMGEFHPDTAQGAVISE
jgi:plastocyanin